MKCNSTHSMCVSGLHVVSHALYSPSIDGAVMRLYHSVPVLDGHPDEEYHQAWDACIVCHSEIQVQCEASDSERQIW